MRLQLRVGQHLDLNHLPTLLDYRVLMMTSGNDSDLTKYVQA